MKTQFGATAAAIAIGFLASGCQSAGQVENASTLRQLDDEVREILVQQASQEDELVRLVTSDQALADLASQAATQAALTKDEADRIAYYRIAAVAYWKAGAAGEQSIADVVAAGTEACASATLQPPRDCAAIALSLPAAQLESEKRKLDALEAAVEAGHLADAKLGESVVVVDRMLSATGNLLTLRPPSTMIAVPPDLREYVDRQVLLGFCNAARARAFAIEHIRSGELLPDATRQEYQRVRSATTQALGAEPVCMDRDEIRTRRLRESAFPGG